MPRYGRGNEVWKISRSGKELHITIDGKQTVRRFVTPEQAAVQYDKLVEEHERPGNPVALRDPRHPQLEAAIVADPEVAANYAVYADWLQSEGDPRGTLMALQLTEHAKTADAAKAADLARAIKRELATYRAYFLGPLGPQAAHEVFIWRFGFIHRAYLDRVEKATIESVLEQLLQHPSGRFLVELSVEAEGDAQPAIDVLERLAPPSLRSLRVMGKPRIELQRLWPLMPQLRRLTMLGAAFRIGDIELPALEQLRICDGEMAAGTLGAVARASWPQLRRLEIDFYTPDHDGVTTGDATIDELMTILMRRDLVVEHLGVHHARFLDELVRQLPAMPIAAQLTTLDLSWSGMTDAHAIELGRERARFPRLARLDVSMNRLTETGIAALDGMAPTLVGWS